LSTLLPGLRTSPRARRRAARLAPPALAAALVVLLVAACGGSSTTVAKLPPLAPGRAGPQSIFTIGSQLIDDPVGTLNQLKRLGVDRVHVYMSWSSIAPDAQSATRPQFDATDPGAYPASGWAAYDTVVRGLAARHMGIDLALAGPVPVWAESPGSKYNRQQSDYKPDAAAYGQWVRAVATRYSGRYTPPGATSPLPRVNFWSIWNEPNLGIYLAPETVNGNSSVEVAPRLYRGLVDAAWSALHATGHGSDTILIGEMAPAGSSFKGALKGDFGVYGNMPPLRFLRALYCVDADYKPLRGTAAAQRGCPTDATDSAKFAAQHPGLFKASGFADHPYPQGLPPNLGSPDEPDYAELAEIPKLERVLDQVNHLYGSSTRFPIWSTEFGYVTDPPNTAGGSVPVKTAARYLNWAEYLSWDNPRIRSYDQYLINDPSTPDGFTTGLKSYAGKPKVTLAAYRMPLYLPVSSTAKGHPLVVWGEVRPAPDVAAQTHRPQSVQIQFRSGSGGAFKTVQRVKLTNPHGYFDVHQTFATTGQVRLRWAYPSGPAIFSRIAPVTLH
jgi:hypothetical protein